MRCEMRLRIFVSILNWYIYRDKTIGTEWRDAFRNPKTANTSIADIYSLEAPWNSRIFCPLAKFEKWDWVMFWEGGAEKRPNMSKMPKRDIWNGIPFIDYSGNHCGKRRLIFLPISSNGMIESHLSVHFLK